MRELSAREKAFLKQNLPVEASSTEGSQGPRGARGRGSARSRLLSALSSILRYLPLAIGSLTLLTAGMATYLYLWGRDLFKISDLERMSTDGTLDLVDGTSGNWLQQILQIFEAAPWVIWGTVVLGILLMGLSMLLIGKRKDG